MNIRVSLLAFAALGVFSSSAHAAPLLTVGFESPYTTGNLGTQQGWVTDLARASDATVTSARAFAGSNSLLMHADTEDYAAAYKAFSFQASTNSDKQVRLDTQIWITGTSEAQSDEGFAGLDVFSDETEGAGVFIGSSTGNVYFYDDFDGGLFALNGAATATRNAWNKLSILLDFSGATPTYYAGLNDDLINLTALGFETAFTSTSTLNRADFYAQGGVAFATNAYYDQLSVQSVAAVPEPATFAVLGLGAVALLRRKRA